MDRHRSNYLVDQLIRNKLSEAEFDEFLAGLNNQTDRQTYSDALETYFNQMLTEIHRPSESDEPGESLPTEN